MHHISIYNRDEYRYVFQVHSQDMGPLPNCKGASGTLFPGLYEFSAILYPWASATYDDPIKDESETIAGNFMMVLEHK